MNLAMRDRIINLYGPGMLKRSALNIRGGGGVFEWALAGQNYRTALEIGTYRGVAAAEIAQYCERVITIDLKHGQLERNGDHFDRVAFWRALGIDNIELRLVADDDEKLALVSTLDFDFAFIDGAHDRTVADDFALVKRCGRVLFHDADDNRQRSHKPGASNCVYEFIATLPPEQVEFRDIFAMWSASRG